MWSNNGFGSNGHFPNGFNNQNNFPPFPSGGPPGQSQQYFPNQQNSMQYADDNDNEGFMNQDFQPEVGLYNDGAFMHNQFVSANPPISQVCIVEFDMLSLS